MGERIPALISLLNHAPDPCVNRGDSRAAICKKADTAGHLDAYTLYRFQPFQKRRIRQIRQKLKIQLSGCCRAASAT